MRMTPPTRRMSEMILFMMVWMGRRAALNEETSPGVAGRSHRWVESGLHDRHRVVDRFHSAHGSAELGHACFFGIGRSLARYGDDAIDGLHLRGGVVGGTVAQQS